MYKFKKGSAFSMKTVIENNSRSFIFQELNLVIIKLCVA